MPDSVPTERVPSSGGTAKKPIPKGVVIAAVVGGVALLYVIKKKRAQEENTGTPGSEYTSQSFIPVTGENVAGVGAGGSGNFSGESNSSTLLESQSKYQELIQNFLTSDTESRRESEANNREFLKGLTESIRSQTGGGAPAEGQNGSGGGSGGGGSGSTKTTPPVTPPGTTTTTPPPASVPVKDIKCGNGCAGHEYPKGKQGKGSRTVECQTKVKGKCTW